MHWQEIKKKFPQSWLLIEAVQAHSETEKRILDDISVINSFKDSRTAFAEYKKLHNQKPGRELYVYHTSRNELEINEKNWIGVRGNNETTL